MPKLAVKAAVETGQHQHADHTLGIELLQQLVVRVPCFKAPEGREFVWRVLEAHEVAISTVAIRHIAGPLDRMEFSLQQRC